MEKISLGKYNSGFYFRGSLQYATTIGGVFTIILSLIFLVYVVTVINNIFGPKPHFSMISKIEDLCSYEEFRESGAGVVGEFDKNFIE